MSLENRALVWKGMEEILNRKKTGLIETIYTPYCHGHSPDGPFRTRDGFRALIDRYLTAFPDLHVDIQSMIDQDDWVAMHYTFVGTNNGPLGIFPATGRTLTLSCFVVTRIEGDRIVEQNFMWDSLNGRRQLRSQALAA